MTQITPYPLWIGSYGALHDVRRLHDLGIRAIVHLAYEETLPTLPRDFIVLRFPILDGEENEPAMLLLAIDTLTLLLDQKFTTLVCCQAGLSRSPAIVAAALARLTGESLTECVKRIGEVHGCSIHPALLDSIAIVSALRVGT